MRFHGHGVLGWNLVDKARRYQSENGGVPVPKVGGFAIDLSPLHANDSTHKSSAICLGMCDDRAVLSDDVSCGYMYLLTSEPVTATLMTNSIAHTLKTCLQHLQGSARTVRLLL